MRKLLLLGLVAALVPLSCKTGRSSIDMTSELYRLEKEAADLEREYELMVEERRGLEVELERTRTVYEEARIALARRDELRLQLEALGYSPTDAGAYATVAAAGGDGQVRREVPAPAVSGSRSPPAPRAADIPVPILSTS